MSDYSLSKEEIINVIKDRNTALSDNGIAYYAEIDNPSEVLRDIRYKCWELVEEGILECYDLRGKPNIGLLFFSK